MPGTWPSPVLAPANCIVYKAASCEQLLVFTGGGGGGVGCMPLSSGLLSDVSAGGNPGS